MDREADATSAEVVEEEREPSKARFETAAIRDGRARRTRIRRIDSGHCARRGTTIHRGLLPRGICRHHRCHRRTTTCERREGERGEGGPTFLCKRVPGDGASEWRSRQDISTIGGVRAPVCNDCAGRGQAPTAGLQHAPSGSVDAVERVTRGLRIEGLAAASASTFSRGSLSADRLPPPPSSARTARTCRPRTAWSTVSRRRRAPCGRRTRGHGGRRAAGRTAWRVSRGGCTKVSRLTVHTRPCV